MVVTDIARRSACTLVAAVDVDPALAGARLDSVVQDAPAIPVHASIQELDSSLDIQCAIVTTRSDLPSCMQVFRDLLNRGIDIVSSCEELLYPWLRHAEFGEELDALAKRNDARILGTGINPGFLMDTFPIVASSIAHRVDRVEVHRVQDASTRRLTFQKKIGATLTPDAFEERVANGTLRHVGLGESLHFIAHYLGLTVDRWTETLEPIVADKDLECAIGPISAGHARGVLQVANGYHHDESLIRLEFRAAIAEPDPQDRVQLFGDPNLDFVLRGGAPGDVSTSAMLINSVHALNDALPGLHTMATIRSPLAGGNAGGLQ